MQATSKQATFASIAMLPAFMLVCYVVLLLWFRSRGGYKPVEIGAH